MWFTTVIPCEDQKWEANLIYTVSPHLKRQKKEGKSKGRKGKEEILLYIILIHKIIQLPIHYILIRRNLHQETITKRRHRPHKEINVKLSKTKNYLGLVSVCKVNSLFKEFKMLPSYYGRFCSNKIFSQK